jgi:hypothetical protein
VSHCAKCRYPLHGQAVQSPWGWVHPQCAYVAPEASGTHAFAIIIPIAVVVVLGIGVVALVAYGKRGGSRPHVASSPPTRLGVGASGTISTVCGSLVPVFRTEDDLDDYLDAERNDDERTRLRMRLDSYLSMQGTRFTVTAINLLQESRKVRLEEGKHAGKQGFLLERCLQPL